MIGKSEQSLHREGVDMAGIDFTVFPQEQRDQLLNMHEGIISKTYEWMLDQTIGLGGSLLHLWKRFLGLYPDSVPPAWNSYSVEQIVEWCGKDIQEQKDWEKRMDRIEEAEG